MKTIKLWKEVNETKMLDISIKNLDKETKKSEIIQTEPITVEEKLDGVKVTLIRNDTPFDPSTPFKNWWVAYKGNLLFPEEFEFDSEIEIRWSSTGAAQFKLIFNWLRENHRYLEFVDKRTEWFLEFLMTKATLSRSYNQKHGIVLLGWASTRWSINGGQIKTQPGIFQPANVKMAIKFNLDFPRKLFSGRLNSYENILNGAISPDLKSNIGKRKDWLTSIDPLLKPEMWYAAVKEVFLSIPSVYDGTIEGVVLKTSSKWFKWIQADQHDKNWRNYKKSFFKGTLEEETEYWKTINDWVQFFLESNSIQYAILNEKSFDGILEMVVHRLPSFLEQNKQYISHPKKTTIVQIKEDFVVTFKTMLQKKLKGNNGALFIGRFQPPTRAHLKIAQKALKNHDYVYIGIVESKNTSDKNPFPLSVIKDMWEKVFPEGRFITARTGNLIRFIQKADDNINTVLAGSDRFQSYQNQLKRQNGIEVVEIERSDDDVSATKARRALETDDKILWSENIPPVLYDWFDTLKKFVN